MTNSEIKKAFQKEFPQFTFSVKTRWGGYSKSVNIVIQNFTEIVTNKEQYQNIAPQLLKACDVVKTKVEKIYRDSNLQEIELGCNTYVSLDYKTEYGTCSV